LKVDPKKRIFLILKNQLILQEIQGHLFNIPMREQSIIRKANFDFQMNRMLALMQKRKEYGNFELFLK
jgi:hypothetical protein